VGARVVERRAVRRRGEDQGHAVLLDRQAAGVGAHDPGHRRVVRQQRVVVAVQLGRAPQRTDITRRDVGGVSAGLVVMARVHQIAGVGYRRACDDERGERRPRNRTDRAVALKAQQQGAEPSQVGGDIVAEPLA